MDRQELALDPNCNAGQRSLDLRFPRHSKKALEMIACDPVIRKLKLVGSVAVAGNSRLAAAI